MSNTGQIKRYEVYGDSVKDRYLNDNGEYVKYDDHLNIVNNLVMCIDDLKRGLDKIFAAEQRIADQLKLIEVAGKRIDELELALLYYADEGHFKHGDVPGHIYALDDAGHIARNALGIDQKEVDRRVLATYYTE